MIKLENELLSKYTSLGLGGYAEFLYKVSNIDELKDIILTINNKDKFLYVLGGGSNLLISDNNIDAAVIKLEGEFNNIEYNGESVKIGAGYELKKAVHGCINQGLSGIESLGGIPGTVGGAVAGNAGVKHVSIGDFVTQVEVIDTQGIIHNLQKDLSFKYRKFDFDNNYIITSVVFKFKKDDKEVIKQKFDEWIKKRSITQPYSEHSAGCVFKNLDNNISAGALIDQAGAKGLKIGKVSVSKKHANFFVCEHGATADDYYKLINKVRSLVEQTKGVKLELEIKLWGEF